MPSTIEIYNHSHEYGDITMSCAVYISKGIHTQENETVLHHVCALLNSGGGILVMENMDFNCGTQSKSLDEWWSGMECQFATILSGDDICHYLDFVGNFDDPHLYLFVKSAEHLCTLDYHCRLPTDTATHSVTYSSAVKLCSRVSPSQPLSSLPAIPASFTYGKTEETLKQEGKQIQFKNLSSRSSNKKHGSKTLSDKIVYYSSKYISAFANHEGGHVYFGIEDTSATVLGEEMSDLDEVRIKCAIENKMKSLIWGSTQFTAQEGVHWAIKFIPVNATPASQRRKVVVVSICKMNGGVFTKCPESYMISANSIGHNKYSYNSRSLGFEEWKEELLNHSQDIKSLRTRFIKLPMMTPHSRLVFSLPHTLEVSRQKVVKLTTSFNIHPHNALHAIKDDKVRCGLRQVCEVFVGEEHLNLLLDHTWSLLLDLTDKPDIIAASLAVFSVSRGLHIVCLTQGMTQTGHEWSFATRLAVNMKRVLVQHGGCTQHLGFKCHVLDLSSPTYLDSFKGSCTQDIYPHTYLLNERSMNDILEALTIAVAAYKPFNDQGPSVEREHYFLLTSDQLELMWTHQLTRELWVHGPPGSGKTIAALQVMRMLRHRGCKTAHILYVAENRLLCSYVRSFDLAMVVSRRELMSDAQNKNCFGDKYGSVRNVIVDEAQNFKDRDGDWYSLLEKLAQQNLVDQSDLTAGYFWLFMDYAQKVHKFNAGLPGIIGKNNFMLREISRNSKEIYGYAKQFMETPIEENLTTYDGFPDVDTDNSFHHLGHDYFSGNSVRVVKCDKTTLETTLAQILKHYAGNDVTGGDLGNVAILASKKREAEKIQQDLAGSGSLRHGQAACVIDTQPDSVDSPASVVAHERCLETSGETPCKSKGEEPTSTSSSLSIADNAHSSGPVVSTVREFSGLDRPVIIGVDPHTDPHHANLDKFLLNLVTRAKDQLVILTTSDELMKKLSPSHT